MSRERNEWSMNLDPRSFHAFERDGNWLLYDRATGGLLQIGGELGLFFSAVENGATYSEAYQGMRAASKSDEVPRLDEVIGLIEDLHERGFFRYRPVDHAEQEKMLQGLWRHRSRRIQLLMAQGCNLGCRYCYAWRNGSNQKGTLMSFEMAKRSVDFLVKRSGRRKSLQVTFFGGEPLLNYPVIQQVVRYCRELEHTTDKRFNFELITNATLLTREVAEFLAAERFLLMISIDGWREMHNYNRPSLGKQDDYDVITQNAIYVNRIYQERGLPVIKVRANLTDKYHDAKKVHEYLAGLGFKSIGLSAIEPLPHGNPSPSAMTEEQVEEMSAQNERLMMDALSKMERGHGLDSYAVRQLRRAAEAPSVRALKGVTCGVARNTAVVDNQGNIYPCHRYEGMTAYVIGSVLTGMDREKTMGYYRKVNGNATNRCHSCWLRDHCAGGCAWLLSAKDGTIHDPTPNECDRRRRSMETALFVRQRLRALRPDWFEDGQNRRLEDWNLFDDEGPRETAKAGCGDCSGGCGNA